MSGFYRLSLAAVEVATILIHTLWLGMGGANSTLKRSLEDEFHRLVKAGREYLVLGELLAVRLPPCPWTLEPAHLASLFVADRCAGTALDQFHEHTWARPPNVQSDVALLTLYDICRNHDGRFSLDELLEFMSLANDRTQKYHAHEFRAQIEAECTLRLFEALSSEGGPAQFTSW